MGGKCGMRNSLFTLRLGRGLESNWRHPRSVRVFIFSVARIPLRCRIDYLSGGELDLANQEFGERRNFMLSH